MQLDISTLPMIDTHEHLAVESHRVNVENDVLALFLLHYITTDLENAGLSAKTIQELRDPAVAIEKRWRTLEPFWSKVSNTAYARALKIAARDLYGIDPINRETIGALASCVAEASRPGLYAQIFGKAGIKLAIVDDLNGICGPYGRVDPPTPGLVDAPRLIRNVIHGTPLFDIRSKDQLMRLPELLRSDPMHSLQDLLDAVAGVFTQYPHAVALKLPHAYDFSLAAGKTTFHDAETVFNQLIGASNPDECLSYPARKPLTDYLIHFAIRQAIRHNLPIQIHTGLLEGTYNNLHNADPMHLIPLFTEYREARFVLFHGSYPWIREFLALGKMFPNVWLDLCWVWIISPQAGRLILSEAIETIPQNKVTAFGGDYIFVEGTYGHSVMARQNIQRVLAEKVAEGWFGADEAMQYARAVLYDNACELYRLSEENL